MFEATLFALPQEEEDKRGQQHGTGSGGANVNADVGAGSEFVPFIRQRLGRWLVDFMHRSRVAPGPAAVSLVHWKRE